MQPDGKDKDTNPNQGGESGKSSGSSQSGQGKGSGQAKQVVASLLDELKPEMEKLVEETTKRQVQSMKDVRFDRQEKRLSSLEETAAAIKEKMQGGASYDEAVDELGKEQRLNSLEEKLEHALTGGNSSEEPSDTGFRNWASEQATILSQVGLEADDPRIVELRREHEDPNDYLEALSDFAWKHGRSQGSEGSSAELGTETDESPPKEDLRAQYEKEKEALPRGNIKMLTELKQKYREKGLDIW